MLALRQAAGLSQAELARAIGMPQPNIAFWEWSDKPPRSDVIPKMAAVLGVPVADILYADKPIHAVRKPGRVGKLQRAFEKASSLPRREQQLVAQFVETLVDQRRRAS